MNSEEKKWVESAVRLCERASAAKVTVMFVRLQDSNNEADVIVTNAINDHAALVVALATARGTEGKNEDDD